MSVDIESAFGAFATTRLNAAIRTRRSANPIGALPSTPNAVCIATTAEERREVRRLRYRVLIEEQGKRPPGIAWERRELCDPLDDDAALWFAREDNAIVGTISQTLIGPTFDLGRVPAALELETFPRSSLFPLAFSWRLVIASTHRSSSVLASLARHVYAHGRERGAKFDFMTTNTALVPLFERMGYRRYTSTALHSPSEGGLLIPLVLPATDHAHLEHARSPCLAVARQFPNEPEWGAWLRASHPLIDAYYDTGKAEARSVALAGWLNVSVDAAADLAAMSYVHLFPAGTTLRHPGDRVISTFLAVSAPLLYHDARRAAQLHANRHAPCAPVGPDGVPRATATIQCVKDTVVLCIPDSAVARVVRRHSSVADRLTRVLLNAGAAERDTMRIFR